MYHLLYSTWDINHAFSVVNCDTSNVVSEYYDPLNQEHIMCIAHSDNGTAYRFTEYVPTGIITIEEFTVYPYHPLCKCTPSYL